MTDDNDTRQFAEVRHLYGETTAAYARSFAEPLARAFSAVRREDFLPAGPWRIFIPSADGNTYVATPSADPIHLYQNVPIALDADEGINNGEPGLHAAWLGAVAPRPGETVLHIGAGRGYYSAILSSLVAPGGKLTAFEIHEELGAAAREHLASFNNVAVVVGDAVTSALQPADVIYVNAGVAAPPLAWLEALQPGGRLIFPSRPAEEVGVALLVTRQSAGYEVRARAPAWFIPCIGASAPETIGQPPDWTAVRRTKSVRRTTSEKPDATATAVYEDLWFSSKPVATGVSGMDRS